MNAWEDPDAFGVNRLPARSAFLPFTDAEAAWSGEASTTTASLPTI